MIQEIRTFRKECLEGEIYTEQELSTADSIGASDINGHSR
jgi:hypothetical protein